MKSQRLKRLRLPLALFVITCAVASFLMTTTLSASVLKTYARIQPLVTNVVCYMVSGSGCGPTFHEVHGKINVVNLYTCAGLQECSGGELTFSGNAVFATTNYTCYFEQYGNRVYNSIWHTIPVNDSSAEITFRNWDPNRSIPQGQTFQLVFVCEGE